MTDNDSKETEEGLRRRAFHEGFKLKNSGLDREGIYARLEKQGITEEIISDVIQNLVQEHQKKRIKEEEPYRSEAWVKIIIALVIIVASYFLSSGMILFSLGTLFTGVIYLLLTRKRGS